MPGRRRQGRGRAKRPSRSERHQRARAAGVDAAVRRAEGAIEISLPQRRVAPESVVAHLGPTNSGKTYHALEVLKERGRGVYAGPLRMLAQEAHRRLSAELGEDAVGLVTGEERINDGAPIICCTVEMAPSSGEVLVLDEVQWADDPERGSAWTRLLLAGDFRHILLLGALDAEPLVLHAFPDAEVKVFERMLPLEFVGERSLRGLTPGHGRRRLQPQGGARARRRDQPPASEQRLRPLRRDAAELAARGDRPVPRGRVRRHRRDRRARPRRQPALRDAALCRDDEVRRRVAARPAAVGAGADRRAGRAASGSSSAGTSAC